MADRSRKGRTFDLRAPGDQNPTAKATEDQARTVKRLAAKGVKTRLIAEAVGLPRKITRRIMTGETWGHVTL